jgi:hypothetical protein
MSIPAGTRFIGIAPNVDMLERKSTQANSPSNVYTIEDIQGSNVPSNRTITINGTTQDLSANRTWTISTGLTVGTTAIGSGTDGRVLFQAGGLLQQDASFFWDNTNKRLGIGATPSTSVPLDVRSQGTLSTDVGFRVRNSANTANLFDVQGNGIVNVRSTMNCGFSGMTTTGGALFVYAGNNNDNVARFYNTSGIAFLNIRTAGNGGEIQLNNASGAAGITLNGIYSSAITFGDSKNIAFNTTTGTKIGEATNQKMGFWNATPIVQPTTAVAAATLVGGGGTTITATDTFDGYTLQQIVKALRNTGLLA